MNVDEDHHEETLEYWKKKYNDLNTEYDEFQKQSFDLENELEVQLRQSEEKIRDLENRNTHMTFDIDSFKKRLYEMNSSTSLQILQLQEELAKTKAVNDERQKYIRELEQKNDDLERTNRCAMFSLTEFETKINEALERNAILESELDEKDQLAETVQRLRDESRDLRQELAVRQRKDTTTTTTPPTTQQPQINDSDMSNTKAALNINNNNNMDTTNYHIKSNTRVNALNYVGDVLRKVTSMESKLIAGRHLIKDPVSIKDRRSMTLFNNFDNTRKIFKRDTQLPNTAQ